MTILMFVVSRSGFMELGAFRFKLSECCMLGDFGSLCVSVMIKTFLLKFRVADTKKGNIPRSTQVAF